VRGASPCEATEGAPKSVGVFSTRGGFAHCLGTLRQVAEGRWTRRAISAQRVPAARSSRILCASSGVTFRGRPTGLPEAVALVRHFLETGKPIAAICHGPLLLLAAGSVKGKTLTCYSELEIDIRSAGGDYVNREVVLDGSLVTARGWPDNGPWMREFVRLLKATFPTRVER
jgi:putative intracellular protease/amidase